MKGEDEVTSVRLSKILLAVYQDDDDNRVKVVICDKRIEELEGPVEYTMDSLTKDVVDSLHDIRDRLERLGREGRIRLAL